MLFDAHNHGFRVLRGPAMSVRSLPTFCNPTVELVNALGQQKAAGKGGQIAARLLHTDLLILDELG